MHAIIFCCIFAEKLPAEAAQLGSAIGTPLQRRVTHPIFLPSVNFQSDTLELLTDRNVKVKEDIMEAVIAGLVAIVVIWVVVIYGSSYMNKNVQ